MTEAPRNIPVPDELAAVRAEIKALQSQENELRRLLIDNPDMREGAGWLAEIKTVTTTARRYTGVARLQPRPRCGIHFPRAIHARRAECHHRGWRDDQPHARCGAQHERHHLRHRSLGHGPGA